MEGPRSPLQQEFQSVVQFLDENLRPQMGWSILDEYPTAFNPNNLHNIRIVEKDGKIISHAVLKPLLLKSPIGVFKVAGIGSVVTSEIYRSQGLSSTVITDCLNEAKRQNCDFAILWTSLHEFYRKFGFELAGSEVSVVINKDLAVRNLTPLKFIHGNKISPEAINRVYNQHTVTSFRTFDDTKKYLSIPKSNVYTTWDLEGTLQAYLVEGKGADLENHIHEWGGSIPHLFSLINYARSQKGQPLTLMFSSHSQNLLRLLNEQGFKEKQGYLGMIKIVNPVTLLSKVARAIKQDFGFSDFIFEKRDRLFYIGRGNQVFSTDSEVDITRLVFGPSQPSELHPFDPQILATLEKVLPIPMWIWGWDSV